MSADFETACPICHATDFATIIEQFSFPFVTSDCRPWHGPVALRQCGRCGTVSKRISVAWQSDIDKIYSTYAPYHQGAGSEQKIQTPGQGFLPRSHVLAERISSTLSLPETGVLLDIGCGNGVFLSSFALKHPGWRVVGNDIGEHFKPLIEAIAPNASYIGGRAEDIKGRFDFISMVHVLEHAYEPDELIATVKGLLDNGGTAFVQVPNLARNPFDLMIFDHATHFTPPTLRRVVERMFPGATFISTDWNRKEISLLARAVKFPAETTSADMDEPTDLSLLVTWLEDILVQARQLRATKNRLGIFGTSIAGTWLAAALGGDFDFFIDEDEARIGRTHMDKPIVSVSSAPGGAHILLPFDLTTAENISHRFKDVDLAFALPPLFRNNLVS